MRSVLLKATLGLSVVAGVTSTTSQASAQLTGYFDLSYEVPQGDDVSFPFCAGVAAGNMTNGTEFVTWTCNANEDNGYAGAKDQAFMLDTSDYFEAGGFFYYSVRDANNYNKCLGVAGGSKSDDATVMIWDCLGTSHPDQYWLFFPDESRSGCYFLYNYHSQLWLGVDYPPGYGGVEIGNTLMQTDDIEQSYEGAPIPWCPHAVSP
jgi:hypothetical protein